MGFFDIFKSSKESNITNIISLTVDRGWNHVFTRYFTLSKTRDGEVFLNKNLKVKILSCSEYHETQITTSAGKKVTGAILGGIVTGGAGAIVGALAFGNNKRIKTNLNKLVVLDDYGYTHEVILKSSFGQMAIINSVYI